MSVDLPTDSVNKLLEKSFKEVGPATSKFYWQLKNTRRVQRKFHVTLMHRATKDQFPELWQRYKELHEAAGGGDAKLGDCDVMLERVSDDLLEPLIGN